MGLHRRGALAALAGCSLALSACGDSPSSEQPAPRRAALPHALGEALAARGDEVASRLDSGDFCGAATEADRLRAEAEAAVAAGRVPAELRASLRGAVRRLDGQIECPPPPPPEEDRPEVNAEEAKKKAEEAKKKAEEAKKRREEAKKEHEEEGD